MIVDGCVVCECGWCACTCSSSSSGVGIHSARGDTAPNTAERVQADIRLLLEDVCSLIIVDVSRCFVASPCGGAVAVQCRIVRGGSAAPNNATQRRHRRAGQRTAHTPRHTAVCVSFLLLLCWRRVFFLSCYVWWVCGWRCRDSNCSFRLFLVQTPEHSNNIPTKQKYKHTETSYKEHPGNPFVSCVVSFIGRLNRCGIRFFVPVIFPHGPLTPLQWSRANDNENKENTKT